MSVNVSLGCAGWRLPAAVVLVPSERAWLEAAAALSNHTADVEAEMYVGYMPCILQLKVCKLGARMPVQCSADALFFLLG